MHRPFDIAVASAIIVTATPVLAAETAVPVLPVYQFLEPYILSLFGLVISAMLTWALAQLQVRTGIHVSDQARAVVQQAAVNAAGRILGSLEGNVSTLAIPVGSPLVAAEVPKVIAAAGPELKRLGVTPERVAALIAGKVGILQASSSVVAAPVVAAPVSLGASITSVGAPIKRL